MFIPSTCGKECFFYEKSWQMRRLARLFEKKLDMFFMLVEAVLSRASYFRPHRQRQFVFFFFVYGNAPGAGHYWNKNLLSASRFLIIQGGSVFHGMPLVQGYEGNAVFRNALPSHEMPWKTLQVQRYEGNSIFRNALLSHEIFHFRT